MGALVRVLLRRLDRLRGIFAVANVIRVLNRVLILWSGFVLHERIVLHGAFILHDGSPLIEFSGEGSSTDEELPHVEQHLHRSTARVATSTLHWRDTASIFAGMISFDPNDVPG